MTGPAMLHTAATSQEGRTEHDLLGAVRVPAQAYWGAHTARALENFPVTGVPVGQWPHLIAALADVKASAARANQEVGLLDDTRADAIVAACSEIRSGLLREQFVVDVVQGGAGTSTNMNTNEVVANRALELLGFAKGEYGELSPHDHVNLSQSTNDVYPTALRVGLYRACEALLDALGALRHACADKREQFAETVKVGRTQLQDAVPMTLGQEFGTYAVMLAEHGRQLRRVRAALCEVNLGGTAIGTGLNTRVGYARRACEHLARTSGVPVVLADDLVAATQDVGALLGLSGAVKQLAVTLSKICNDLRLLSSGPQAGLGDLVLPAVQAGSSIMPGKVNPVIPEVVNQIAFAVIGRDVTVTLAAEAGQLQLNAFEPAMARALFDSLSELTAGCQLLDQRCVRGITADPDRLLRAAERSAGLVTALAPHIGYRAATDVATTALTTGAAVRDIVDIRRLLAPAEVDRLLGHLLRLTQPARP